MAQELNPFYYVNAVDNDVIIGSCKCITYTGSENGMLTVMGDLNQIEGNRLRLLVIHGSRNAIVLIASDVRIDGIHNNIINEGGMSRSLVGVSDNHISRAYEEAPKKDCSSHFSLASMMAPPSPSRGWRIGADSTDSVVNYCATSPDRDDDYRNYLNGSIHTAWLDGGAERDVYYGSLLISSSRRGDGAFSAVAAAKEAAPAVAAFIKPEHLSAANDTVAPDDCPNEKMCQICFANHRQLLFVPCGHLFACIKCTYEYIDTFIAQSKEGDVSRIPCPMCKTRCTQVVRAIVS